MGFEPMVQKYTDLANQHLKPLSHQFYKAKSGIEPLFSDLQSITLPLCYMAYVSFLFISKKFNFNNLIKHSL